MFLIFYKYIEYLQTNVLSIFIGGYMYKRLYNDTNVFGFFNTGMYVQDAINKLMFLIFYKYRE